MRPKVLIDGRAPEQAELEHAALVNYGHFTAMQVRNGAVRGLDLHLARLTAAHSELFGTVLDPEWVRQCMRAAIASESDAYLRLTLFEMEEGDPRAMTAVRPPVEASPDALSLQPVEFQRPLAHIKNTGSLAQIYYGELAEREGFDDAVLVTPDGLVAETTMANVGFISGRTVVWPVAPVLRGITWQLLDGVLPSAGLQVIEAPVKLADVGTFDAAFTANSVGIEHVGSIASHAYGRDNAVTDDIIGAYETVPWDVI